MNIYIHSDSDIDTQDYDSSTDLLIDIDVTFYSYEQIAAALSTIKKIRFGDKKIDEQALAEYESFIKEAIMEIESRGFQSVKTHGSPESVTSHYYVYGDAQQIASDSVRGLIFLRISDHKGTPTEYQKQKHIEDRNEMVKRYRAKKWWEPEIVVNSETFASYDDAIEKVKSMVDSWIKKVRG